MTNPITVSLVIPIFNESLTIPDLITTIKAQTFQPKEIILVDGGSTDNTVTLLRELTTGNTNFRIIEAGRSMPGKGRNIGAGLATSEWIAFTDAGITLHPQWLNSLVEKATENPGAAIIYGNFSPQINNLFDKCATIAYVPALKPGAIRTKAIVSYLIKNEVWRMTGGFPDWRAAEDLIFMEKAEELGYPAAFASEAMVYWQLRQGMSATYKKFELYSKYNVWAGRQAYWHYGIAKQYAVMLLFIVLAILHTWYWLLWLPLLLAARTAKRILSHRYEFGIKPLFNPVIFFMVMWITVVIDVATFSGWIKALWNKEGHRNFSLEH